jgi:hypothetical protein
MCLVIHLILTDGVFGHFVMDMFVMVLSYRMYFNRLGQILVMLDDGFLKVWQLIGQSLQEVKIQMNHYVYQLYGQESLLKMRNICIFKIHYKYKENYLKSDCDFWDDIGYKESIFNL